MASYSTPSTIVGAGPGAIAATAQPSNTPPSLRSLQKKALLKLLNLNQEGEQEDDQEAQQNRHHLLPDGSGSNGTGTGGEPVWKFLVFDKMGQDVISSVLRVSDLRDAGVTVHMQLKADRQQMEDVPASK